MLPESMRTWCQSVTRMRSKAGAKQDCGGAHASSCEGSAVLPGYDGSSRKCHKSSDVDVGGERKDGASVEEEREQRGTN